jgi:IMP cyclohydrolase
MPIRDAMALSLLALDYEHDQLDTPRIAAAVRAGGESGFLGVVRRDGLNVHELALTPGTCWHVSTYEHNDILPDQEAAFDADSAPACCRFILQEGVFAGFLNPISAVCAYEGENGFELAAQDV